MKITGWLDLTGVHRQALLAAILTAATLGDAVAATGTCKLGKLLEIPVTMEGLSPTVHASINGSDAVFIADSGAFFGILSTAAAAQYRLRTTFLSPDFYVGGVGGDTHARLTRVKSLGLAGFNIPDVDFLVLSNDAGAGTVGLLGQNVWRLGDVEYDLGSGVIRLLRPHDCGKSILAYWAAAHPESVSIMEIDGSDAEHPFTRGIAYINGQKVHVTFDTGAAGSLLTLDAARRIGVTPNSAGVTAEGSTAGIGPRAITTWIAPFDSFRIGNEEIRHTRLRIGDYHSTDEDMLLGADFFLSHHIYVSNSQRRLYFTYNGGPVFRLPEARPPGAAAAQSPQPAAAAQVPAPASAPAAPEAATPTDSHNAAATHDPQDAAAFSRRGSANAARHDYAAAIADFTRACELGPAEARYRQQRGQAYWDNNQPEQALADFDAALKLSPADLASLLARARLRLNKDDTQNALIDLGSADRAAPAESPDRLEMGELYTGAGVPAQAIRQFSLWIDVRHEGDVRMADALDGRCWARALANQELDGALKDCSKGLRIAPKNSSILDSRGLVYLRRGEYRKAIDDYSAALKLQPRRAWSLYGRGLAELLQGNSSAGDADVAAAKAINAHIAEDAAHYGIGSAGTSASTGSGK